MSNNRTNLTIVTYNLLSPDYIKPSYFPNIEKQYLDDELRLERTIKLLNQWITNKNIICLQELCEKWMINFKTLFESNNYNFHYVIYAKGKSGVAIAYPTDLFDTIIVEEFLCADYIKYDKLSMLYEEKSKIMEELKAASQCENKSINIVLKIKKSGELILLSTYHMPCQFLKKMYMTVHIYALKANINDMIKKYNCQHVILAGDFNITAKSPEYNFLVGIEELEIPEFIKELQKMYKSIEINLYSPIELKSAHLMLHNKEPEYTNISTINGGTLFKECLDYCIVTKTFDIIECTTYFTIDNPSTNSYPNNICPSDHLPLITKILI
jgi:mRNA deadenylase 3'-5' endonuclease subunit Ccr4